MKRFFRGNKRSESENKEKEEKESKKKSDFLLHFIKIFIY
jgi:hypothetical protein